MGTLAKVSVGVAVAALALVVWWREAGDAERSRASGAEASARSALQPPPQEAEPAGEPAAERIVLREPVAQAIAPVEHAPVPAVEEPQAAGADPASSETPPTPLERDLDTIAETFLSENFDAAGLLAVSALLAQSARVVPESFAVGEDGKASGKLELGSLRGSYTIDGSRYQVQLEAWSHRKPFAMRGFTLRFNDEGGVASQAWANLQFHPNGHENASESIGDEERLVGWTLRLDPVTGTSASATTMKAIGAGWRIGNASEAFQEQNLPGLRNGAAFDAWLARLRPARQR